MPLQEGDLGADKYDRVCRKSSPGLPWASGFGRGESAKAGKWSQRLQVWTPLQSAVAGPQGPQAATCDCRAGGWGSVREQGLGLWRGLELAPAEDKGSALRPWRASGRRCGPCSAFQEPRPLRGEPSRRLQTPRPPARAGVGSTRSRPRGGRVRGLRGGGGRSRAQRRGNARPTEATADRPGSRPVTARLSPGHAVVTPRSRPVLPRLVPVTPRPGHAPSRPVSPHRGPARAPPSLSSPGRRAPRGRGRAREAEAWVRPGGADSRGAALRSRRARRTPRTRGDPAAVQEPQAGGEVNARAPRALSCPPGPVKPPAAPRGRRAPPCGPCGWTRPCRKTDRLAPGGVGSLNLPAAASRPRGSAAPLEQPASRPPAAPGIRFVIDQTGDSGSFRPGPSPEHEEAGPSLAVTASKKTRVFPGERPQGGLVAALLKTESSRRVHGTEEGPELEAGPRVGRAGLPAAATRGEDEQPRGRHGNTQAVERRAVRRAPRTSLNLHRGSRESREEVEARNTSHRPGPHCGGKRSPGALGRSCPRRCPRRCPRSRPRKCPHSRPTAAPAASPQRTAFRGGHRPLPGDVLQGPQAALRSCGRRASRRRRSSILDSPAVSLTGQAGHTRSPVEWRAATRGLRADGEQRRAEGGNPGNPQSSADPAAQQLKKAAEFAPRHGRAAATIAVRHGPRPRPGRSVRGSPGSSLAAPSLVSRACFFGAAGLEAGGGSPALPEPQTGPPAPPGSAGTRGSAGGEKRGGGGAGGAFPEPKAGPGPPRAEPPEPPALSSPRAPLRWGLPAPPRHPWLPLQRKRAGIVPFGPAGSYKRPVAQGAPPSGICARAPRCRPPRQAPPHARGGEMGLAGGRGRRQNCLY
ncbi:collagen alpha-1(I) chain-like [Vulpes lagopus]|uniref:collagen alpha-1(I) chain-like n=1 Tax=Vulpes lagopus TaxID=494514 RepID=UPI001BC91333|nr:collagen alpha-1(I) chain-like [Vulpes lagopus]